MTGKEIPTIESILDFKNKVTVVTGSNRNIGRGIAIRFAQAGALIIVHYKQDHKLAGKVVHEINDMGGKAITLQADVTSASDVAHLVDQIIQQFNHIDVWINNAGIYPTVSLLEMSKAEWDETISTNLHSVFLCTQAVARTMIDRKKGGVIINIASIEGSFPADNHSHYNTAKAGVIMHTRAAARELASYGIRVNAVSPGLIWSPGIEEKWPEGVNAWKATVPLHRLGQPEDIADACLFLASPAARWITGINLVVDGGASTTPSF